MDAHWKPLQQLPDAETPPQGILQWPTGISPRRMILHLLSILMHEIGSSAEHDISLLLLSIQHTSQACVCRGPHSTMHITFVCQTTARFVPLRKMCASVTAGLPLVKVPVLSKITILTRVALSSASAPCRMCAENQSACDLQCDIKNECQQGKKQ